MAFVVTVFLYLKFSPPQYPVHDHPEGEQITLLGEVCKKEYKSGYQGSMLVIELKNVQGWSPGSGQEGETSKRGNVICYIEANEGLVVPKAGSVVAVEGEVSYFDTARNPGEFDAQDYYRILGVEFRLYKTRIRTESSRYSAYHEILYQLRCHFEGVFDSALAPQAAYQT